MASPLLPIEPQRPSFSPADCRTLQKMLHDVRSPSPLSPTPYFSDGPASQSILTGTPNSKNCEDTMSCENHQSAYGDEQQDGYEDEDDSMELSDGEDAFGTDERDSDTIEDIMNMPGKMASSVPVRDYSQFYPHNQQALEGTPPASNFSVNFSYPACAAVWTPNGKHIDFATCDSIPDSSVDHTLSCVKAQESDQISPSEHQGHASPQRTLTELAREARVEKEEEEEQRALAELDQFRDMDLAPIETVMDGGPAGDLITYGTPVKAKDEELSLHRATDRYGSELEGCNHIKRWQSSISPPRRNPFFIEQDQENGVDVEESNTTSISTQQQLSVFPRRPTFITVISMLPAAMFWATIAQVVDGSNKVFDVLIEGLTGLKV
ncbi:hypothetical protein AG0111_0g5544 [Alternaria gaisen]|uniref:Uncharacterized protein n=1 Tax=Alternaria gaisen TaxID=167740 RepID=A0ACB6FQT3_9PLEO|nr:hypothetical protein AG0111_0g5544 [Alternaria gaisen]